MWNNLLTEVTWHKNTLFGMILNSVGYVKVYALLPHGSSPLQVQKSVQLTPWALHAHLFVAHGVLLAHPHFRTFKSSLGANGVSSGTTVGISFVLPSMHVHPWSVASSAGGSV